MREKFKQYLGIIFLLLLALILAFCAVLDERVKTLEQICHGQCQYGDAACAKRCKDQGHCERFEE